MKKKNISAKAKLVDGNATDSEATGYGKPPQANRFKPGKSGNPLGRPLGSKNHPPLFGAEQLKSTFLAELNGEIVISDGKANVTQPVLAAILQALIGKAISGNIRAAQFVFEMARGIESEHRKEYERFVRYAMVYLQLWGEFLDHARRCNLEYEEPVPHPRQFVIDRETGILTIRGRLMKWEAESDDVDQDDATFTQAVARRFMATMTLPPGHDIRHYIRE